MGGKLIELVFEFHAMGGLNEIRLAGAMETALRSAAAAAIAEVRRIESKYSRFTPESIISRINACAGSSATVELDQETLGLFEFAQQLFVISHGHFDITSGVLRKAWTFREAVLPAEGRILELLPLIGWQKVNWPAHLFRLPVAGMEIDLGGIGKEYAADRARDVCRLQGVELGYVNLGGDISILGAPPDTGAWQFGIRDPRIEGALMASLNLPDGAMATSGDYERFVYVDGKRYCHLINPLTGWPVQDWQSITVIAPSCAAAGSISSIAMLAGDQALAFLQDQGVAYLAVRADGSMHQSSLPL